jgi:hypothetical protein
VDANSGLAALNGTGGESALEDRAAVGDAICERMRELKMPAPQLARETGLSPTTIRHMGQTDRAHHEHALVALSAVLGWRYDHLTNILHGQLDKNTPAKSAAAAGLERVLHSEARDRQSGGLGSCGGVTG